MTITFRGGPTPAVAVHKNHCRPPSARRPQTRNLLYAARTGTDLDQLSLNFLICLSASEVPYLDVMTSLCRATIKNRSLAIIRSAVPTCLRRFRDTDLASLHRSRATCDVRRRVLTLLLPGRVFYRSIRFGLCDRGSLDGTMSR